MLRGGRQSAEIRAPLQDQSLTAYRCIAAQRYARSHLGLKICLPLRCAVERKRTLRPKSRTPRLEAICFKTLGLYR